MILELNQSSLAHVLFKRLRLVWASALGVLALAVLYCIIATPKYQAEIGLVVSFSPMPAGVPADSTQAAQQSAAPVDHEEIINSYAVELQSAELAREVISDVGVDRLYPPYSGLNPIPYVVNGISRLFGDPNSPAARERQLELAADHFLKKDLKVESERNSNVITATLLNPDRELAVAALKHLTDRFIERQGTIDRDPRLDFIRGQLEVYRKRVAETQAAMEAFELKNGISSMDEERTALIQERANLEQSIIAVHSRVVGDEKSLRTLRADIARVNPVVTTAQDDRDPLQLTARTDLAELRAREQALSQAFSDSSQAVQDTRKHIKATEQLLAESKRNQPLTHAEANSAYQQLQVILFQTQADLDSARESEASQRHQLERLNGRLATRDRQEGTYQDAVRDYQLADQNYRLYLQGVESARIADDLNKQRITSIAVFNKAYADTRPARPRWKLIILLGAIAGLLCGLGAAFLAETLDEGLSTPQQVAQLLKLPVLGSMERV